MVYTDRIFGGVTIAAPDVNSLGDYAIFLLMTDKKNPDPSIEGAKKPVSEADETSEDSKEVRRRKAPDPTRYGDWEKNGRCIDF